MIKMSFYTTYAVRYSWLYLLKVFDELYALSVKENEDREKSFTEFILSLSTIRLLMEGSCSVKISYCVTVTKWYREMCS